MTIEEEKYLLNSIENIRKTVGENNAMLKQIVNYLNGVAARSSEENMNDFVMNIIANIISNRVN